MHALQHALQLSAWSACGARAESWAALWSVFLGARAGVRAQVNKSNILHFSFLVKTSNDYWFTSH